MTSLGISGRFPSESLDDLPRNTQSDAEDPECRAKTGLVPNHRRRRGIIGCMNLTGETLAVFLLLMPGFLASVVLNAIVVRPTKDRIGNVIEAFVFSFVIYAILTPFGLSPVDLEVTNSGTYRPNYTPNLLPLAVGLAVGLALVLGFLITNDYHMKLLRKARVTVRTARTNTWLDVFIDQKRYVVVTFTDGRRLFGWPEYYSNDTTEGLLYVSDPAWIGGNDEYTDLDVHGILLTANERIESIVFTLVGPGNAQPRTGDSE